MALGLLCGLSRACQKLGDLGQAVEALKSALPPSMRPHGSESSITLTLVSRLKATSERQEILLQHHKAVVAASAATSQDPDVRKRVLEGSQMASPHDSPEAEGQPDLDQEGMAEAETTLLGASYQGDQDMVKLLLGLSNLKIDPKNDRGRTPLSWAVRPGYEGVIVLLLEKGAAIESKSTAGRTSLSWAAQSGNHTAIQLLLKKGANVKSRDVEGRTMLSWATRRGYGGAMRLLLERCRHPNRG